VEGKTACPLPTEKNVLFELNTDFTNFYNNVFGWFGWLDF